MRPARLLTSPASRRGRTITRLAVAASAVVLLTPLTPEAADAEPLSRKPPLSVGATPGRATVDNTGRTVVDVTDFGADPTGKADSAAGIRAAVDHAKKVEGPTTLHFPTGAYEVWPEETPKRELYVSNTVGTDQSLKTKNIGILIEDMRDVVVDGGGSSIVNHGYQTVFAAIRSTNVRFTNFSQDWTAPKTVEVKVSEAGVADGRAYRVIDVPKAYGYAVEGTSVRWSGERSPKTGQPYWSGVGAMGYTQIHDPARNKTWRGDNPLFKDVDHISDLGGDRLRIDYKGADAPADRGHVYAMRETTRDTPGALFWQSKDIAVDHVRFGYLHGFGMVGQFSENVTVDSVEFATDRTRGRVTSGFADHIQMSGVKGTVRVKNSVFDNPQDDPINVHGTYVQAESTADKTLKLRYMHAETAGFPQFRPGDKIELVNKNTMLPEADATATVTAVDGPTGTSVPQGADPDTYLRNMTVTLNKPLPAGIRDNPEDYVAENTTYTPSVEITDNSFRNVPTRGVLVTTRKPVRIENNHFDGMGMSSIYISSDAQEWYESGPVRDITIRGNVFDRPASPVISFDPTNRDVVEGQPVHRNATIEDNDFNLTGGTVLAGRSVGDLTFRGNRIKRYAHLWLTGPAEPLRVGDTATLTTDAPPEHETSPLFTFDGADNVSFMGNSYDKGFNQRVDTSHMPTSEISLTGDDLALNADRTTSAPVTVTYAGSDDDVATVDSAGRVEAVGEGTVEMTARATIGGQEVSSNTVTLSVR